MVVNLNFEIRSKHIMISAGRHLLPFIVFGKDFKGRKLVSDGRLADVAPTFLNMMKLPQPEEMTGRSLLL